jgi:hypothetical protein
LHRGAFRLNLSFGKFRSRPVIRSLAAAAVIGILAAGPAAGQAAVYRNTLDRQMATATEHYQGQGFSLAGGPYYGSTAVGERQRFAFPVQVGFEYVFYGVCDQDCTDVDMRLFNAAEANLGQDVLTDDRPAIPFAATASGIVFIETAMATCSTATCFTSVQVYMKRSSAPSASKQ